MAKVAPNMQAGEAVPMQSQQQVQREVSTISKIEKAWIPQNKGAAWYEQNKPGYYEDGLRRKGYQANHWRVQQAQSAAADRWIEREKSGESYFGSLKRMVSGSSSSAAAPVKQDVTALDSSKAAVANKPLL